MDNQDFNEDKEFTAKNAGEDIGKSINSDDSISGHATADSSFEGLVSPKVDELERQLQEQKDKYLRLFAEFDNFRRRTAKEKNELIATGGKDVMLALLDVLDDMERAEKNMQTSTDVEGLREGLHLIVVKLRNTLEQKGLRQMELLNKEFDPENAEAISEIPAPSPDQSGMVLDVVQQGYALNDRIIRFAKVVVGK